MLIRNDQNLKKYLIKSCLVTFLFLVLFFCLNKLEFFLYNRQNNIFLNNLVYLITSKYETVSKEEIVDLLNENKKIDNSILSEYGIDLEINSFVLKNESIIRYSLFINLIILFLFFITLIAFYLSYSHKKNKELINITKYLESINKGIYKLEIDTNSKDELSILKNEIYKITVMLKEQANISQNDKILLKTSLEDLSHQLRTPLTSISIMLDNISDPNMKEDMKQNFIHDIKREVLNISFLINTLLKLSKFDANTITFHATSFYLKDLIKESVKNVSMLAELKNIKIEISGENSNQMIGDFKWQIEAITNILKNCIEHSRENSKIEIIHHENKLYSSILIKDNGVGMDAYDLKHIFERFYKGKNSSSDSIGIGLSLAKMIIENDNGYIDVSSLIGEGSTFTIKYMK